MKYRKSKWKDSRQTVSQTLEQQPLSQTLEQLPKSETTPSDTVADPLAFASTISRADPFAQTEKQEGASPAQPEDAMEIPPSLYARFEAFEFLGRGGMGAVFKARDIKLGREVAVKLLFGADPQLGGSLLREARAQARIVHENVCEVYEAGTADQVRFIVMELIRGEPLDKAKTGMTLEEKVRVIRQIASALHEAHRLGIVHRDVKPANIMVERGEDGAWKPYIMDFGLARDMGDSGATVSGALMGTPSFMSPEQASGKVRSLDRRTDVYCLGATLYDVIVGRPPLVADGLAPLLQAIIVDEPLSPRQIDRDLPFDLDAIVMRCIAKHPAARYESAHTLGDDLQRFLDGEPVAALKRAYLYALWRRAKRHKGKLIIGSAILVVTTVFVGGWLRAKFRADVQANLTRELGENVKEMEFFLRNTQGMPLHDIERERTIVRKRLEAISATMKAAGDIGEGPGHYALGRGLLALQEPTEAVTHLQQAEKAGYRAAGLDYAMGAALSEIYQKELARTKRMDGEQKKQRLAKIEAEYKQPALAHLKAAIGSGMDAPSYAEGLIAFYEGRHEDALAKTRQAFNDAPWLYEAKKLEGDVLFAMGSKFGHDAAFDFDKMTKWFGEADNAYRVAADIGRSDPSVHEASCELQMQVMCGAYAHESPMRPGFDVAKSACGKVIAASPSTGAPYAKLADAHAQFAWRVASGWFPGENPEQALEDAAKVAEESARRNAGDAVSHYVVGAVWRARALYESDRGLDEGPAVDHAISAYEEALKRDPAFLWALNENGSAYSFRANREFRHGIDAEASVKEGLARCNNAIEIDSNFVYATATALPLKTLLVEQGAAAGRLPAENIQSVMDSIKILQKQAPTLPAIRYYLMKLAQIETLFQLESGGDPIPALTRAETFVDEYARNSPTSTITQRFRGDVAALHARIQLARNEDPSRWVADARNAFDKTIKAVSWDLGYRVRRASVELWALRWALRQRKATVAQFDDALAPLLPLLDVKRDDPRLYQVIGEIKELRAEFLIDHVDEAKQEMTDALDWTAKALAINPRMTSALSSKGRLLLLQAHLEKDRAKRPEMAKAAMEAFQTAIRVNPNMKRQERLGIDEARRIVGERDPASGQ